MVKYSFIVPVYNTEKYLRKCIDSILNQTYDNFELIIVNDGSTDNSKNIINEYKDKRIILLEQKNQGLSAARNNGVKHAIGDYIIFVDSDDYIEKDLLKNIKDINSEIIRFQLCTEDDNYKLIKNYNEDPFDSLPGEEAFNKIVTYKYVEPVWSYAINRKFYLTNKFKFNEGKYHEDFGLTPLIIISAKSVTSINYIGYHYIQRQNSIMSTINYDKEVKKAFDMLEQYEYLKSEIASRNIDKKSFLSFISNSVIIKARTLKGIEYKKYVKRLNEDNTFNEVLDDTLFRKLKKTLMKINLRLYLKVIK